MFITSRPLFTFSNLADYINLFFKKKNFLKSNLIFTTSGRSALILSLKKLKIRKKSKILIPSYICESVPKILKLNKFKIVYFDINIDGSINKKDIINKIKDNNIEVVIFVNYFGLNKSINKRYIAKLNSLNCKVVYDCSHTYLTNTNKIYYDAVIFSFRKVFPLVNLGAYLCKNNKFQKYNIKFKFFELIYIFIDLISRIVSFLPLIKIYLLKYKKINIDIASKNRAKTIFETNFLTYFFLGSEKNLKKNFLQRKKNFDYLNKNLKKEKEIICFNNYNKDYVPQSYIISIRNEALFSLIIENGFKIYRWPGNELPNEIKNSLKYKNANYLNNNLICIPIHNLVKKNDLDKLIKILKNNVRI